MNTAQDRVETTLFLLISVDGKITSGESDALDPDWDWKRIHGVREGLRQYYEIEKTIDWYSLITARVWAKLGANDKDIPDAPASRPPQGGFVLIDRKPHFTARAVEAAAYGLHMLYLVTNNEDHPAFGLRPRIDNLEVIYYPGEIDLLDLFSRLKHKYGIDRITIQSGGSLNAALLRQGLIDHVSVVVAPLLVGGQATPSLVGGAALQVEEDLTQLRALKLVDCRVLKDSYLHLTYDVINETVVDSKQ